MSELTQDELNTIAGGVGNLDAGGGAASGMPTSGYISGSGYDGSKYTGGH